MAFSSRHIGPSAQQTAAMCERLGVASPEALLHAALPSAILDGAAPAGLPGAGSEEEVLRELAQLASRNKVRTALIGQGYYETITPQVIARNVLENPAWYTAYTPYQPEISQGRLEALLNFQTMVADLTGLPVAGASLLDEATAVAEAMMLMRRAVRGAAPKVLVDRELFPASHCVLATRAEAVGVEIVLVDLAEEPEAGTLEGSAGLIYQLTGASGRIASRQHIAAWTRAMHQAGGLVTAVADLLAATLVESPGALGADIAVGTTQRFGVPLGYGGPHAGYLAVGEKYARQLPGRLVGASRDAEGRIAYRLALQTREQHIRREKATSNICTAQVLLAVTASMYAIWHGPEGLRAIAERIHRHTGELKAALEAAGIAVRNETYFDTLSIEVSDGAAARAALAARDILVWHESDTELRLSLDERTTPDVLRDLLAALAPGSAEAAPNAVVEGIPAAMRREGEYLTHPTFHRYRSETAMMRYLRGLADKDYALDRGMIPLGSCTMKLNSAIEMAAITWPEFARLHPYAPAADAAGYRRLVEDLTGWLSAVTGYDATSIQPNAGSQGEFAGLLAIRKYHTSRGEDQRTVCLIPASAHGTNAASAVMAGLRVVVVSTGHDGSVDLADLRAKIAAHRSELAAIMITYPSTHGTYETDVVELCELVHEAGGQVYVDGANLNALAGVARPGAFGGDVSHLNLHKTFAIPHGGGGPGVGPVCVKAHLAPFLPGHPLDPFGGRADGAVSGAPYGSASILPISWAYMRLLGGAGLRAATAAAVLAANYVVARLEDTFPILYRGAGGYVAHECIVDLRELRAKTGITVDDVAKRLIDYGFHAPTMSFPVAGTLMVEPTESEDLGELDRFCDAMIAINAEAQEVAAGRWPADDNPLVNAPHTAECVTASEWAHPYSREVAAYAGAFVSSARGADREALRERIALKYWPPVARIDGAYGDRNLVCSCPDPSAFEA